MRQRLLLVLLIVLLAALPCLASNRVYLPDNYPIGYTFNGYTKFADGWHYQDGLYRLVEYKDWISGHYGKGYWQVFFDYKYVGPLKLNYKDPNWRTAYVELLRDKSEADAFERSMQAAGLQYGPSTYYQRSIDIYPTQYRREAIDLVTPINQDVFLQQSFKLTEGIQVLQSQAFSERKDLVAQQLQVQALRDVTKAYELLLRANQPAATIRQDIQGPKLPDARLVRTASPELVAIDKKYNCTGCHQESNPPIKWSLQSHMTLDSEKTSEVIERLVTKGKGHMPKGGPMLSTDEVVKFMIQ